MAKVPLAWLEKGPACLSSLADLHAHPRQAVLTYVRRPANCDVRRCDFGNGRFTSTPAVRGGTACAASAEWRAKREQAILAPS